MRENPVIVERRSYRGANPAKLSEVLIFNEHAAKLEAHVNEQFRNGQRNFLYSTISRETGIAAERVGEILFCINCGSNGFTLTE